MEQTRHCKIGAVAPAPDCSIEVGGSVVVLDQLIRERSKEWGWPVTLSGVWYIDRQVRHSSGVEVQMSAWCNIWTDVLGGLSVPRSGMRSAFGGSWWCHQRIGDFNRDRLPALF